MGFGMRDSIERLRAKLKYVWSLRACESIIGWDQLVMMPAGGGGVRAEQKAALSEAAHSALIDDSFRKALDEAEETVCNLPEDSDDRCLVRAARWHFERARALPTTLVKELAHATGLAYPAWVEARKNKDFTSFVPYLEKVYKLSREAAHCYGFKEHVYDALLEGYEPGMTASKVSSLFSELKRPLVELVASITSSGKQPSVDLLEQDFAVNIQRRFVEQLAPMIGFDMTRGRIDLSVHPFCSASSSRDVRLTLRYCSRNLPSAVFGLLHEAGHGMYEQGSPSRFDGTPLKGGCSLGIHESQSRLWENHVGRSREFWEYHYPRLQAIFPYQLQGYSIDEFYKAINKVRPSFIRVEADEVTYCLHILLRFEIECKLLEGALEVTDIPEVWNSLMEEYLGIVPPDDAAGCLQDVHWSEGLIGYFPTYCLGSLAAAQIWEKASTEIEHLGEYIARGDYEPLRSWLAQNIYCHGAKFFPEELMVRSTGRPLEVRPFLQYLQRKFSDIYAI